MRRKKFLGGRAKNCGHFSSISEFQEPHFEAFFHVFRKPDLGSFLSHMWGVQDPQAGGRYLTYLGFLYIKKKLSGWFLTSSYILYSAILIFFGALCEGPKKHNMKLQHPQKSDKTVNFRLWRAMKKSKEAIPTP